MGFTSHNISILFLLFLYATTFHSCISTNLGVVHCNEKDQHTLSIFKQGVIDPFNRLSTWSTEEDCCAWKGVQCDNYTGRVTKVDLKPQRYGYRHYQFQPLRAGIKDLCLSNNFISGDISQVTINSLSLKLDHNNFTGGLPQMSPNVSYVDLSDNSFSGSIPQGFENWKYLYYINLRGNKLNGKVPFDLSNMIRLEFMDLGRNEFSGTIPMTLPLSSQVMILRSNQFVGNIPPQLFNLSFLFHLDLAYNMLSGSIPQSIYNITAMAMDDVSKKGYASYTFNLFTKGHEYEYKYNGLSRTIDFSANNLSGEIPLEIFKLVKVQTLNLSHNHLTGRIPETIGDMKSMESLDLSNNEFYGEIPQSMAVLSFLNYLNLSCNSFYGKIPLGTQLQSFDASSYLGNLDLCGAPLTKNCSEENLDNKLHGDNEDGELDRESLHLGMGVGFAVGFWVVCGSLFLNRTWRHTYFRFLNHVAHRLHVVAALNFGEISYQKKLW
ncbi:Leucine-rich repeat [Sesbania bispinosa]|nr:Leucine-rich repeat [Sesbania bispinosa]